VHLVEKIGAFAGLASFVGLAFFALLSFTQARDIRRLREWAGSAPERDAERKDSTSAVAAQRAEELRRLEEDRTAEREAADLREERRQRREAGLPELTRGERVRDFLSAGGRLAEPRYLVAIFVVVVLIGGGVAYALIHGVGGSSDSSGHAGKVQAAEVEVAVLNGTAVAGLAGRYGEKVEHKGFKLGAVTNSSSSFVDSVVMYRPGHAPEGHRVARMLGIGQVRSMTSEIGSVSAGAPVAVIVGEDNASSAP
jgi:hypothetical protein